jgi:general L-amino acid transport system substrate-binding protein
MVNSKKNPTVKTLKDLNGASICVQTGTTTELNLTDRMRAENTPFKPVVFETADPTFAAYDEGRCDAVTTDISGLISRRTLLKNPADHTILDVVMSKEPLGPVVPMGDTQWFNVVKWMVFELIEAEEYGITSKNVDQMLTSKVPEVQRILGVTGDLHKGLGLEKDWVVRMIKAVGNYGEIFDRNLGPNTKFNLPRGVNNLWTKGGLLYAPPYR